MLQEKLPLNVFSSMKTLQKEKTFIFLGQWRKKKMQLEIHLDQQWKNSSQINNDSRVMAIRSEKDIEHIKIPMDNPRNPN